MSNLTISDRENLLFEKIKSKLPLAEQDKLVIDGLCYGKMDLDAKKIEDAEKIEVTWRTSPRRVLILSKECNDNGGEDIRSWDGTGSSIFFTTVSKWLYYLNTVTAEDKISDITSLPSSKEIFLSYPVAQVNVKKTAGTNTSDWATIRANAEENREALQEHIRKILQPNIVVCCGSNDSGNDFYDSRKMISIAIEFIYPDLKFVKVSEGNNWCYYNKDHNILLIDSYHPSYVCSYEQKVVRMAEAFQDFLKRNLEI